MTELLQHLLTRSAGATPDAPVIVSGGGELTYAELDQRSNQLARLLVDLGAGRGVPIAMCVGKGPLALVAIFGILKSGSCYVPVDPVASAARAGAILADAGISIAVADGPAAEALGAEAPAVRAVSIDVAEAAPRRLTWADVAALGAEPLPDRPLTDEDPAYILYTSGSTGTPKGVALSHLAALTFVRHCLATFEITAGDRLSSHAPLGFDLSIFDIFVAVAAGATIVPISGAALVFPRKLAELIAAQAITVWYSVPFALQALARQGELERFTFEHLRIVLFAGEPMPVPPLCALIARWPAARFYNLYGPTETNVVTWHEVDRARADRLQEVPIGRPWPNCEVRILDADLREVPAGEAGELCVRSRTAMSGYWGAAAETAAAFVEIDVQQRLPPRRFYRTGDFVRADEQGVLWFLGRRDDMVKVRGHRVELAEVEAALRGHPGVGEVAAVALPDDEIGAQLVAAATPAHADRRPQPSDVMQYCAARLPAYMQPRRIELLAALPRTANGKLDRRQLARELAADPPPTRQDRHAD